MGDYAKKPKNYKRGRCLEASGGGNTVATERCAKSFPCLMDIMVLAGLEQPCGACSPCVQGMRDLHGWERHPAEHGIYYTSKLLTRDQQQTISHRIGQADIRNWINNDPPAELPFTDIKQQIAQLETAGWVAIRRTIWRSPAGTLHIGPHGAWKIMKAQAEAGGQ